MRKGKGVGPARQGVHREQVDIEGARPPSLFGGPGAPFGPLHLLGDVEEHVRTTVDRNAEDRIQERRLLFVGRQGVGLRFVHRRGGHDPERIMPVQSLHGGLQVTQAVALVGAKPKVRGGHEVRDALRKIVD
jgi:hypothetical protein